MDRLGGMLTRAGGDRHKAVDRGYTHAEPWSRMRHARRQTALLMTLALSLTGLVGVASAQNRDDGSPAELMGMGDNKRASVWGPAALYLNPAGLIRTRAVLFGVDYGYLVGKDGHSFGVSAVDAQTNQYAAMAVAYDYIVSAPGGEDVDGNQFRGGVATMYQGGSVGVYAGVGLRYLGLEVGKDDDESTETNDIDAWTVDAGLIFDIAGRIRLGLVGSNLIDTGTDRAAREFGAGLSFVFDQLEITGDMSVDLADRLESPISRYGFGAEYIVDQLIALRAGFTIDQITAQEHLSFGLGYASPDVAVDLGYTTAVDGDANAAFGVSIRYRPIQSGKGGRRR
jgi:hypothetical protein